MPKPSLTRRVEILEEKVGALEELPTRMTSVELQIVQLRDEMRGEFSAGRREMAELGATLRGEIAELGTTIRGEMGEHKTTLRDEIRTGDEETRRYMRVLHEDLVGRLALLQEGRKRRP